MSRHTCRAVVILFATGLAGAATAKEPAPAAEPHDETIAIIRADNISGEQKKSSGTL